MSVRSSDLQAIFDRVEAGKRLSQDDLRSLVAAIRSQQVTIATGEQSVAIGGSADGAVIITGDRNVIIHEANSAVIRELIENRSRHETILLHAVKSEVSARLKQSLHNVVLIQLGMETQPAQVRRPWDADIKIGNNSAEIIPEHWSILQVFDEVQGKLLVLGAPGSGKTTTLLELAQALCERAEARANFPIPVILNLSTWKQDKQLLRDWLIVELQSKYGIRKDISFKWLRDIKLLPMLDGLDEMESSKQEACVRAINQFLKSEERSQYLIVCSRIEEYSTYTTRLHLNGAIYLRELTASQIKNYLIANNRIELWKNIGDDSNLLELVRKPLMLTIATLAYEGISLDQLQRLDSTETRLQYLLDIYLDRMLSCYLENDLMIDSTLRKNQIKNWLIWLAKQLQRQCQTEFLIEKIQPIFLSSNRQKILYFFVPKLFIGFLFGLGSLFLNSLFGSSLYYLMAAGLSALGLLIWMLFSCSSILNEKMSSELLIGFTIYVMAFNEIYGDRFSITWLSIVIVFIWICKNNAISSPFPEIETVEKLKLNFKSARREFLLSFIGGLSTGLTTWLGFWLDNSTAVLASLWLGLWSSFLFLMVFGLTGHLISSDLEVLTFPNQGIKSSLRNAIVFTIFLGLVSGLVLAFAFVPGILQAIAPGHEWGNLSLAFQIRLDPSRYENLTNNLYQHQETIPWAKDVLVLSQKTIFHLTLQKILVILRIAYPFMTAALFSFGIVGGLTHGGIACIRHFTLRVILYCDHCIPWNYARFLNYCTNRLLLQRVGGRYRFIHRLLQEHFAAMSLEGTRNKQ